MKGKELHFSIDLSKIKHEVFIQKEKESQQKLVERSSIRSNKKTASSSRLHHFSSKSHSTSSIRSYGSSYSKYYKERSMSRSNFNISSVNQKAKKKCIKKEKKEENNKSKDNTIRKSTLPLSQIYRNASPYSDLFTWNNLFSYRHIQHNISQEHCNNFSPKSNNTTAHRKTKEHQEQMLNDEKVPHNIRKQSQCSEYLIKKKNEMLEGILSKKNIDYSKMNMQNYSSYSVLPFRKKLSYLIEKKCKE